MVRRATEVPSFPAVGARVMLRLAGRDVVATVVEDRGRLGVGGRRIVRVRVEHWADGPTVEFEVPAEDVRPAA